MKKFLFLSLALTMAAMVGCNKSDGTDAAKAFSGTITHDGTVRQIARAAFYVNEEEDSKIISGYRIYVSPYDASFPIRHSAYNIMIDLPAEKLGQTIDLSTDDIYGENWDVCVEYVHGAFYDAFWHEYTEGTLKVTRGAGNWFEVELDMTLPESDTHLACSAKGWIGTQYDDFFYGYLDYTGNSDFSFEGQSYPHVSAETHFYGKSGDYYNTDFHFMGSNNDRSFHLFFYTFHSAATQPSGEYTFSEDKNDMTFDYGKLEIDNENDDVDSWRVTGGSIVVDRSGDFMTITLKNVSTKDSDGDPGETINGTYSGRYIYRDYSDVTRSGVAIGGGKGVAGKGVRNARGSVDRNRF